MSGFPSPGSLLLWKFLCSPDAHGTMWWRWEAWTQAQQLVLSSAKPFETLTECQSDARVHGYIDPEKRR